MVWDWAGLNFCPAAEELTERPSLELSELKSGRLGGSEIGRTRLHPQGVLEDVIHLLHLVAQDEEGLVRTHRQKSRLRKPHNTDKRGDFVNPTTRRQKRRLRKPHNTDKRGDLVTSQHKQKEAMS